MQRRIYERKSVLLSVIPVQRSSSVTLTRSRAVNPASWRSRANYYFSRIAVEVHFPALLLSNAALQKGGFVEAPADATLLFACFTVHEATKMRLRVLSESPTPATGYIQRSGCRLLVVPDRYCGYTSLSVPINGEYIYNYWTLCTETLSTCAPVYPRALSSQPRLLCRNSLHFA